MTLAAVRPDVATAAEDPWTVPNRITAARTVLALGIGATASARHSLVLLAVAYAVYWVGDMLDGLVARWTHTETRQGAVMDILCDRASCGLLAATFLALRPGAAPALAVFLLQFMVVDCLLSLGFLHWPILSPNHFGSIDRRLYRWNWSPLAKATNTSLLVLLVAAGVYPVALVVALAQLGLKSASLYRLTRLVSARGALL